MSKYIYIGFYGTSLSPVITQIAFKQSPSGFLNIAVGILICMIMGFVPAASGNAPLLYSLKDTGLYNVGFARRNYCCDCRLAF